MEMPQTLHVSHCILELVLNWLLFNTAIPCTCNLFNSNSNFSFFSFLKECSSATLNEFLTKEKTKV